MLSCRFHEARRSHRKEYNFDEWFSQYLPIPCCRWMRSRAALQIQEPHTCNEKSADRFEREGTCLPDTFSICALRSSQTLQMLRSGSAFRVRDAHLDHLLRHAIVELAPACHAPLEKVSCRNQAIGGFFHTDCSSGHHNQNARFRRCSAGVHTL